MSSLNSESSLSWSFISFLQVMITGHQIFMEVYLVQKYLFSFAPNYYPEQKYKRFMSNIVAMCS